MLPAGVSSGFKEAFFNDAAEFRTQIYALRVDDLK